MGVFFLMGLTLRKRVVKTVTFCSVIFVVFLSLVFVFKSALKFVYPLKYTEIVEQASNRYNVEKELIYAIIKCESGFDENAKSHAGACGLMQITPETFEWLKNNSKKSLSEIGTNIHDPGVNIICGTVFISLLLKKYNNEIFALSAYNAGMNAVDRWIKESGNSNDVGNLDFIPYPETKEYVGKVERAKRIYKELYFNERNK